MCNHYFSALKITPTLRTKSTQFSDTVPGPFQATPLGLHFPARLGRKTGYFQGLFRAERTGRVYSPELSVCAVEIQGRTLAAPV